MQQKKIQVGDTLYANPEGFNISRYRTEPMEVTVQKVGSKYFTVHSAESPHVFRQKRFHIDTLREASEEYSGEWQIYVSLQEIKNKDESAALNRHLEDFFRKKNKLSLSQLRRVVAILEEGGNNQ